MDKKIVLAVAGSGKTYYLCNKINPQKRNLVIAFTNENINNIVKEILKKFGNIPNNTVIMTFHRFVYHYCIRPYEWLISQYLGAKEIKSNGVSLIPPPDSIIKGKYNSQYFVDSKPEHYYTKDLKKIFCSRMSKLAFKTSFNEDKLLNLIVNRFKKFYDYLFIDEFQDFREYDYDLLNYMIKHIDNFLLVGDYYQHSVNGQNNSGKPFKKAKKFISYIDYLTILKENFLVDVDTTTLIKSRRCKKNICDFIKSKIGISIEPYNNTDTGKVNIVSDQKEIIMILKNDKIKKLLYRDSDKYSINCINWGACKGNTYEEICVVLTVALKNLINDNFDYTKFDSQITLNKLYVALSRSSGDVNIITSEKFKQAMEEIENIKN